MKYPQTQFNVLSEVLTELNKHFAVKEVEPTNLHFLVYQQVSETQAHNKLVISEGTIKRANQCKGLQVEPLIKTVFTFDLYPQGCNDNHINTAVNKILNTL